MRNKLFLGNNTSVLKKIEDNSIDVIYTDPPFNSDKDWFDSDKIEFEVRYFSDMWAGGIQTYLSILEASFTHFKRVLKDTGNIFIHCDPFASHYIKVFLLDKIFGENNFRSEIIWRRATSSGGWKAIAKNFGKNHDVIFWYTKSDKFKFSKPERLRSKEEITKTFTYDDNDGKGPYQTCALTHENEKDKYQQKGELIIKPNAKFDRYKFYLKDHPTIIEKSDVWADIKALSSNDNERVNYPTQKPIELLKRIILCSSDIGDLILDPFMGSGTTCVTAQQLQRYFIGIDISPSSVALVEDRLRNQKIEASTYNPSFKSIKYKYTYDEILNMNKFKFEKMIIKELGGIPNEKQVGDLQIDGYLQHDNLLYPVQVKCSKSNVGRPVIDGFCHSMKRDNKTTGYIISFGLSKNARKEIARIHNEEKIIINHLAIDDILDIVYPISLKLSIQNSQVIADALSPNGKIVAFLWRINEKTQKDKGGILDITKYLNTGMTVYCNVVDEKCATAIQKITI